MHHNDKKSWYAPLAPQYQIVENAMPLYRFAAVEAVLHLLSLNAPDACPEKAYLLFTQYQLIGNTERSPIEYLLQRARDSLGYYRSQKYWLDDLKAYREERYHAFRAFSFKKENEKTAFCKAPENYPYPYQSRLKEWERLWTEEIDEYASQAFANTGVYHYWFPCPENGEPETASVSFSENIITASQNRKLIKSSRPAISITVKELLDAARQMAEIKPGDPCYSVLQSNIFKKVENSAVSECKMFDICEVVNVVGMVGSGKSTLIKVLCFWCHNNGYQITVVVDTVAEALNLWESLSEFHIHCSPLIGHNERLKYINQVARIGETCLPASLSQYLTPACLVDGMDTQHSGALEFGKEPCYRLKKGGKNYLCPFFNRCSGTKMLRECYSSSVVITTVAGFAASRVGALRETFLQVVLHEFDLVIFDECDRVQRTLDQLFMPETSFNSYISECAEDCSAYMKISSKLREENPAAQRYDELQRQSVTVLSCLTKSLHRELGSWKRITRGDPFTALKLLEDLYQDETGYKIPSAVYHAIYQLIDPPDENAIVQSRLWAALESSCKSTDETLFNQMYCAWLEEVGADFPRPAKERTRQIQDARIKLILRLIYFDHFIRNLCDAYEACHAASYGQNELFGYLQTRFRIQQNFLPSALCGNLFGLKKTEDDDIILFRQFAFGRSLMKDLPYLCTDAQGNPAGPHVLLLSGSSWAEGSFEYHVNRPVNYILEADAPKRSFLEKTCFYESGFSERVSGTSENLRFAQLSIVTQKTAPMIIREYERKAGKILLVVNSYAQAKQVQATLSAYLQKAQCPARVCYMVSDTVEIEDDRETIRRGEVNRFAFMSEEILIAPAMAIERGHNIVDEQGHSALGAVFFMVRPMAVPDDIQQKGCKLNGFVETHCKRIEGESLFDYNLRVRQFAARQWAKMSKSKPYGLTELDENEQKDIVATLFVLILQIFGRLARVTDVTKPEPHVYFIDGAFRGRQDKPEDFDCLSALGQYLEQLITHPASAAIAQSLYEPFYKAYQEGIYYEKQ